MGSSVLGMVVGVIGVGRMGLAVCARLAERGFDVVANDRRSEVRTSVADAGARWVDSASEVARCCGVVLTLLPDAVELAAVREQLVSVMAPGSTWIDMTTSTPAAARRSAELASGHGVRALDAPMGGGPVQAREGNLVLFVGGSVADLEAQRVVTDALADRVLHVGGAGSGCLVKLLVNLLWFGHAIAGAEVLSLAARAGLDPELVRSVVSESAGASRFMDRDARTLLDGDDLASFSLAGCVEELNAITTLAGELKVPLALGTRVADLYAQALQHYGDVDGELLAARLVSERAGVDFKRSIP